MKKLATILLLVLFSVLATDASAMRMLKLMETTAGSGGGEVSYEFRDEFSDTLAAGSVHGTTSMSGHTRTVVDTFGTTELIGNRGFETVTAVGPPADFATWAEVPNAGNIEVETTSVHSGTNAVKLTAEPGGGEVWIYPGSIAVRPSTQYSLKFWTRGDGTNAGRYSIYDSYSDSYIVLWASTGVTGTSYTEVTYNFTTSANATYIIVYMSSPLASSAVVYYDDFSLLPTSGLLSITGGNLSFSGGKTIADYGDPGIWYPAFAKSTGLMFITMVNFSTDGYLTGVGLDSDTSGDIAAPGIVFRNDTDYVIWDQGTPIINTRSNGITYGAIAVRNLGAFIFHRNPSDSLFKLQWHHVSDVGSSFYPMFGNWDQAYTSSFGRIPSMRYLPVPLVSTGGSVVSPSDGLGHAEGVAGGLGSGGSGVVLTGSTWSSSGTTLFNAPTESAEIMPNNDFESWASATDLNNLTEVIGGTTTINREATVVKNGTYSVRIDIDAGDNVGYLYGGANIAEGIWYKTSCWGKAASGTPRITMGVYPAYALSAIPLTTDWVEYKGMNRVSSIGPALLGKYQGAGLSLYLDTISVKSLTTSSLFLTAPTSTSDVLSSVKITKTGGGSDGLYAGLITNLDSASTPANFLIHYLAGDNTCKTDKAVAGVYSNIGISAACAYSAGANLIVSTDAGLIRMWYNNAVIDTSPSTVSDAGIINNTIHGLFSTGAAQTFDDWTIYARGTEGQYAVLNQFIN